MRMANHLFLLMTFLKRFQLLPNRVFNCLNMGIKESFELITVKSIRGIKYGTMDYLLCEEHPAVDNTKTIV